MKFPYLPNIVPNRAKQKAAYSTFILLRFLILQIVSSAVCKQMFFYAYEKLTMLSLCWHHWFLSWFYVNYLFYVKAEFLLHNRIIYFHLQTSQCIILHKSDIHIPHIIVSISLLGAGTLIHAADQIVCRCLAVFAFHICRIFKIICASSCFI